MGIKRLALSLFTLGGVELNEPTMFGLQPGITEPAEDVLLHRMCSEEGNANTEANGKRECLECGDGIPIYSNFFCEKHMIEFLMDAGDLDVEFSTTKARFTNSHSQQDLSYSI